MDLEASTNETSALGSSKSLCVTNEASHVVRRTGIHTQALALHPKLPDDILGEIFAQCDPSDTPAELCVVPGNFRLVFCKVSSQWRRVALNTYTLWTDVKIDFNHSRIDRVLEILPRWLAGAKEALLYLEISTRKYDERIVEILRRYAPRCHTLVVDGIRLDGASFDLPRGAFGRVKTLRLGGNGNVPLAGLPPSSPAVVFEDMPLVSSVTFSSFHESLNRKLVPLPWRQLTSLYFEDTEPSPWDYYAILEQCVNVAQMRLDVFPARRGAVISLSNVQISLPALRTLELNTDTPGNGARFLHSIALDNLVDLEVSFSDDSDRTAYLVRPLPALQRLVIDGPGLGSQLDLELWLQACPVAVEVHLHSYTIRQQILDEIAMGLLLPCLQRLTIAVAPTQILIAALEARQRSVEFSTIAEIGVNRQDLPAWELEESEKMRLARLRLAGVYVGWVACHESLPNAGEVKRNAMRNVEHGINPLIPAYGLARKASAI
ncbi:hypothetical protein R3P38DRAFT_2851020 [Favolaschia claudopus]|uniref:F-box domain-containing protein n=1 Tax=Favolaschia claudopus TaxID=2862362 RepID=A0AAW0DNS4_9AGAR